MLRVCMVVTVLAVLAVLALTADLLMIIAEIRGAL